jgi:hypothetical protein
MYGVQSFEQHPEIYTLISEIHYENITTTNINVEAIGGKGIA